MTSEQLVERGKAVYASSCIACHNANPKEDGAAGPAIAGSSLELIRARVLHAQYPAGYAAKRQTRIMVALPHLEKEIPALSAFIDSLKTGP